MSPTPTSETDTSNDSEVVSPESSVENNENAPDNETLEQEITDLRSEMVELRNLLEEERESKSRGVEPATDSFSFKDLPIPTPGDIVHFTNEYTIPALIKLLEVNIKLLKGLQMGLRVVDPHYERGDGISADSTVGTAMDKLRDGLTDVDTEDGALNEHVNSVRDKIDNVLIDPEEEAETIPATNNDSVASETEKAIQKMQDTIDGAEQSDKTGTDDTGGSDGSDESSAKNMDDEEEPVAEETDDTNDIDDTSSMVDVESELKSIKKEVEEQNGDE